MKLQLQSSSVVCETGSLRHLWLSVASWDNKCNPRRSSPRTPSLHSGSVIVELQTLLDILDVCSLLRSLRRPQQHGFRHGCRLGGHERHSCRSIAHARWLALDDRRLGLRLLIQSSLFRCLGCGRRALGSRRRLSLHDLQVDASIATGTQELEGMRLRWTRVRQSHQRLRREALSASRCRQERLGRHVSDERLQRVMQPCKSGRCCYWTQDHMTRVPLSLRLLSLWLLRLAA